MTDLSAGGFANLERLVAAIGADEAPVGPGINRAALLAELAAIKTVVDHSALPNLHIQIPQSIRLEMSGPEVPVPDWSDLVGGDTFVTGPEIDTKQCPVCKRPL